MSNTERTRTPIALTIAGSDSGGGAGVQADLKTFSALGVYGASVITALTAQNTTAVTAIHDVPADFIREQLHAVLSDLQVNAIKIGMLSQPAVIETVAMVLAEHQNIPVVLDPVMVAKSGDKLLQDDAVDALTQLLLPRATLITPNLPEAATLLNTTDATSTEEMLQHADQLLALGAKAVLIKGGHLGGDKSDDLFKTTTSTTTLQGTRVETSNTHGTGCSLSSAIAAFIALGASTDDAVVSAKQWIANAIAHADDLTIGKGHGPVHHFHALWPALNT